MSSLLSEIGKLRTEEVRVGVVGIAAAGKTVFLTSLIDHLQHHDPSRFRLGPDGAATLRKFQELPPEPGWEHFDYPRCRDAFVHGQWPGKTCDRSQFVCSFERSDWYSLARLVLFDLPGERIADAVMLAKDFAGWSDHYLSLFHNDAGYRACAGEFLGLLSRPGGSPEGLLASYKRCLAQLITSYRPYVSPSTYLLDSRGRVNRNPGEGDNFCAGLTPGAEFCPLPAQLRASRPDLTASFSRAYEQYRQQIVVPVLTTLAGCHTLVVLVDVAMLLAGGVGMYNDNRQIVLDLLDVLSPGQSTLGHVFRGVTGVVLPYWLRPSAMTKVAFAVPKVDQVHPSDRDRIRGLLEQMLGRAARDHDGLRPEFFNCSAVVSTEQMPSAGGQRFLRGVPLYTPDGRLAPRGEMQKFQVSEVPTEWPADWPPFRYRFPDVYPRIPPRKDAPPPQINLDRLLDFVMS